MFCSLNKIIKSIYRKFKFYKELSFQLNLKSEVARTRICDVWNKECPIFIQDNLINPKYDLMIIIAAYNTGDYLEECIQSFLLQKTKYTFYTVIVDDGSTDNSSEVLKKYSKIENIKIIHQDNRGFSGARNRALEEIYGKYVMFLDSDDILMPNAIECLMDIAVKENADIVAGGYNTFSEKGLLETYGFGNLIRRVRPGEVPGFTCMKIIRSELLADFCFSKGFLFEDTVLSKLVYPKCNCVYTVPDIVYGYRVRKGSISHSYNKKSACIDTFWITKFCLEESVKRGYSLDMYMYKEYLKQCYVNYLRTRYLSEELQESLFVLTVEMLNEYWQDTYIKSPNKFKMLDQALKRKSFKAYRYILERWELF